MNQACCDVSRQTGWKKSKALWSLLLLFAVWLISVFVAELSSFRHVLEYDFKVMLLPLLAGLFVGGMVEAWVPSGWIMNWLSGRRKRNLFYSVGLGFLMSSCSHGLLAIAIQLYRKGASRASVVSFLLASPWANLAMTFLLIGFFKIWGIVIIFSAIAIALITGLLFQKMEHRLILGPVQESRDEPVISFAQWRQQLKAGTPREHFRQVVKGVVSLSEMVLPWIALGIFLAAVSVALVPQEWFENYLGPDWRGLFATLGLASVIEVCSEGMSFLAFELYNQTGAMGNAFVFLMAGVVTDFTEISLVWKNLGWKSALAMIFISVPQVLLLGWVLNTIVR